MIELDLGNINVHFDLLHLKCFILKYGEIRKTFPFHIEEWEIQRQEGIWHDYWTVARMTCL